MRERDKNKREREEHREKKKREGERLRDRERAERREEELNNPFSCGSTVLVEHIPLDLLNNGDCTLQITSVQILPSLQRASVFM